MHSFLTSQKALESLKAHRRALHSIPELGFNTFKTQSYVCDRLQALLPDELRKIEAGAVAVFKAKAPVSTLAFRADMDALPMKEETGHAFASEHEGIMHACGHDGHMALLLTFAEFINGIRDSLLHDIVLVFQPGEEGYGGADMLISKGALNGVDAVFGLHLIPSVNARELVVQGGALMAATCEFDVRITGVSAHGALPHEGADAALAAAHFLTQAQAAVSRFIDPIEPAVVTFGMMRAGTVRNVIASDAALYGTARSFSAAVHERIFECLREMLAGIEHSFNVKTELIPRVSFPAVINDEKLARHVQSLIPSHLTIKPLMIAEDFACYRRVTRTLFMFLGCGGEGTSSMPLHTPRFDFDEAVLLKGLQAYAAIAQEGKIYAEL